MVRVEQVDESSSLLLPVGRALPGHRGFFLSLRQNRVAPLEPHLAQEEVDAEGPHQEAQGEGPSGAGALHGDTVYITVISQRIYRGTQHIWWDLMGWNTPENVSRLLVIVALKCIILSRSYVAAHWIVSCCNEKRLKDERRSNSKVPSILLSTNHCVRKRQWTQAVFARLDMFMARPFKKKKKDALNHVGLHIWSISPWSLMPSFQRHRHIKPQI